MPFGIHQLVQFIRGRSIALLQYLIDLLRERNAVIDRASEDVGALQSTTATQFNDDSTQTNVSAIDPPVTTVANSTLYIEEITPGSSEVDIDTSKREMDEIALEIHKRFLLHEPSIVNRHIKWLAGIPTLSAKNKKAARILCEELLKRTNSELNQITTLKAICTLAVEAPYIRDVMKGCEETHHFLQGLATRTSEEQLWATRARKVVELDHIHVLWSNFLTTPISGSAIENLQGNSVVAGGESGLDNLVELKRSLSSRDPSTSFVANLYLGFAKQLEKDGPLEQDAQTLSYILRDWPVGDTSPTTDIGRMFGSLCLKMLKYMSHPVTAMTAMEGIKEIAVNPAARKVFQECGGFGDSIPGDAGKEVQDCAETTLTAIAVSNNQVHDLWSEANGEKLGWSQLCGFWRGRPSNPAITHENPMIERREGSLRNPKSASLAEWYLNRATDRAARDAASQIRQKVAENKSDISSSCIVLLECAAFASYGTATVVLERIIELAIEYPFVRKTLKSNDQILRHAQRTEPEILKWKARALQALDNEDIHALWSKAITDPLTEHDMQHLLDRTVYSDKGRLADLAKTLSVPIKNSDPTIPIDLSSSYLAYQHLKRAARIYEVRQKEAPHSTETPALSVPENLASECQECQAKAANEKSPHKWNSEQDLLTYVLESAPDGSLKDLTGVGILEAEAELEELGRGGFAKVLKGSSFIQVKGKALAVKKLDLNDETQEFVIKNFARELRVSARLNHPNVLAFLGYVREDNGKEMKYCLVTEIMAGGSLREYLNSNPEPTMIELLTMSLGIAKGVSYLHSEDIVHADLKAANVLISRAGNLVLADFGLARMAQSLWSKGYYSTSVARNSLRWIPYEYFHLDDADIFRPNQKTDVWAFGMTLLEILTLKIPYGHIRSDGPVLRAILSGEPPVNPSPTWTGEDLKKNIWSLCSDCWTRSEDDRPEMESILHELIKIKYRYGIILGAPQEEEKKKP